MQNKHLIIYCDGGSRGNPGPAAAAFVVVKEEKVLVEEGKYLGVATNNFAEYSAVIMALDWLIESRIHEEVTFNLDSQLIERQINNFYKVKNEKLKILHNQVKLKISNLKSLNNQSIKINFVWNYRSNNSLADKLVNETLDLHSTGKD